MSSRPLSPEPRRIDLRGKDRLIVALDVPTSDEALRTVDQLDNVSFFKVGWQLFLAGDLVRLLERLRGKQVFVDLKVPGDIGNTIRAVVDACVRWNVKFLTLSESVPPPMIEAARRARGSHDHPKFLTVPFLSSLDASDLKSVAPDKDLTLDEYILTRAAAALRAGCDGVIASGDAISLCRGRFGQSLIIVSPGIRPAGAATDDHKRHTTPTEAIRLGADYLVVGRPILQHPDPHQAAADITAEIDAVVMTNDRNSLTGQPLR
jgi:orotidine-5'-phosphate decarboxylase